MDSLQKASVPRTRTYGVLLKEVAKSVAAQKITNAKKRSSNSHGKATKKKVQMKQDVAQAGGGGGGVKFMDV